MLLTGKRTGCSGFSSGFELPYGSMQMMHSVFGGRSWGETFGSRFRKSAMLMYLGRCCKEDLVRC